MEVDQVLGLLLLHLQPLSWSRRVIPALRPMDRGAGLRTDIDQALGINGVDREVGHGERRKHLLPGVMDARVAADVARRRQRADLEHGSRSHEHQQLATSWRVANRVGHARDRVQDADAAEASSVPERAVERKRRIQVGIRSVGAPIPLIDRRKQPGAVPGQILRYSAARRHDRGEIARPEALDDGAGDLPRRHNPLSKIDRAIHEDHDHPAVLGVDVIVRDVWRYGIRPRRLLRSGLVIGRSTAEKDRMDFAFPLSRTVKSAAVRPRTGTR